MDTDRFPDLGAMVAKAHALNLTAGFYSNNCRCADHCTDVLCFAADANAILAWGFDSVKLDGCGKQENVELWYNLFNWSITASGNTRKPMILENCHNGPRQGSPAAASPFGPFDPTPDWCPFHMYRASTDIRPVYASVLTNLLTIPPLAKANLSRPGCWAYPDVRSRGIPGETLVGAKAPRDFPASRARGSNRRRSSIFDGSGGSYGKQSR